MVRFVSDDELLEGFPLFIFDSIGKSRSGYLGFYIKASLSIMHKWLPLFCMNVTPSLETIFIKNRPSSNC
jgi:hypothetical protein